ncbi:uncharacterized protein BCR38DRAFT_295185, partial [Pseudomassariella vexata]
RNDLMMFVGYLEFFHALDFPANVWNEVPVKKFAMALMIVGGTLAILASCLAFVDLRRSWRNVRLLREERAFLRAEIARTERLPCNYLQACQSANFRELGWEVFDRVAMDGIVGFAGILVGTGTIMAIGGANHRIFHASNLLSGYVGNGFVAFYGLINAIWSVYLWQRGRRHCRLVTDYIQENPMQKRARQIFRNHQIYAVTNAVTLVVSSIGSLISSTRWWGYVILIPCIFGSVFCNMFWRKKVGYDRLII